MPRLEGQPRPLGQQPASRGDHRAAVVNHSPSFVSQEIGEHVSDVERTGTVEDQSAANLRLAESEMAGAGIEDHIDRVGRHSAAGPSGHPGVFTNFKADLDSAQVEDQIADRIFLAVNFDRVAHLVRPGFEPSRFVMQSVAAQESLAHETRDAAIDRQTSAIEQCAAMENRQAQADRHAFRRRQNLLQDGQGGVLQSRTLESVFAAIAADAQFGQAEDACALKPRGRDGGEDVVAVARPIHRGLVEYGGGDADASHGGKLSVVKILGCQPFSRRACSPRLIANNIANFATSKLAG